MMNKLRSLAHNAHPLGKLLVGIAANADTQAITEEADGWLMLAPYGETPYYQEEQPGDWKKYVQSFQKPQAEAMTAAFNSLSTKKGARFKGLPIYSGHPDVDPVRWPDERRLGGVIGLQARDNGLYVKVAWNSLGEENRKEAFLVYPSPAWDYDRQQAAKSGRIEPDELRSVGLTNTPRIQDSIPWVNSDDPSAPDPDAAASSQSQSESNTPTPVKPNFKKMLCAHLGMPEDTSDDDLQKAHDTAMGAKATKAAADAKATTDKAAADQKVEETKAALANSETARQKAQGDAEKFRKLATGTLLDTAINTGKITAAERPALETAFNTDFDATVNTLKDKKVALNTTTIGLRPAAVGVDLANPHSRRQAFNARIDQLMRDNAKPGVSYGLDDAIRDMRVNPDDAALLKAMEPAAA